ncbi:hypothetical protein K505DRAFT_342075 [Melanomma pulvis-pyrius CBS 109.77]|uniref:Uncharacterized protein n=1 Tax=Melanomma pulvis-pyrius CBS 109.77 TaxID=1314802 RepID=A0A6A6WX23_9PLEO|nr:hypothetical protein K505DRAFT_342075 [Melanomma pulvis-pyrius CBS 109.77]
MLCGYHSPQHAHHAQLSLSPPTASHRLLSAAHSHHPFALSPPRPPRSSGSKCYRAMPAPRSRPATLPSRKSAPRLAHPLQPRLLLLPSASSCHVLPPIHPRRAARSTGTSRHSSQSPRRNRIVTASFLFFSCHNHPTDPFARPLIIL